jgi:uncharacterized protein YbbC (DUF1343 family)
VTTRTGLDVILGNDLAPLRGKRFSVVCNQATIASDYRHFLDHLLAAKLVPKAVFGPQHGLWGHTQDNMIEWEPDGENKVGFPIYSLYGEHREPTHEMLADTELLVIDLPDIGARYYTFIWTTALCMKVCEELGIPILILDRPNPIGGLQVEGTLLDPAFASFVGLYPLPTRHGMTLAEIADYLKNRFFPGVDLQIEKAQGWTRDMYFADTGLPWAMPSPNMPTPDTAIVYPGACLLEGTNLSEGRGTTRPFEMIGAPHLDGWNFCERLNHLRLPGAYFRPIQFLPTFQKHAGSICEGAFVHVTNRESFNSFLTYVAVLQEAVRSGNGAFEWKSPPYEYEYRLLPIDILAGNDWLRKSIDDDEPLARIEDRCKAEIDRFEPIRANALLYS